MIGPNVQLLTPTHPIAPDAGGRSAVAVSNPARVIHSVHDAGWSRRESDTSLTIPAELGADLADPEIMDR